MPAEEECGGSISISMLGGLRIKVGEKEISENSNRTHQIWNLLEYLIAFRSKSISQSDLIGALWPNDTSENPANALKNLVYRIRTMLRDNGIPQAKDFILLNRGSYRWNNKLDCIVDVEEFEKIFKKALRQELDDTERIRLFCSAIDLYKGDFLPNSCYEEWVVPLVGYYRNIYFKCIEGVAALLIQAERLEELESICEKGIVIDPFEEAVHRLLIYALAKQGKNTAALEHYNHVTDLFYRELGVKPSEEMRNLYRRILKSVNSVETDLSIIKEDLREHSQTEGAFCCDYEVFRNMYRIEARSAARTGQSMFVGLLTATNDRQEVPDVKTLSGIMDKLLQIIRKKLRRGDVVARFSATQYVLMLPTLTFENGEMVLERICRAFAREYSKGTVHIQANLQPLDPIL